MKRIIRFAILLAIVYVLLIMLSSAIQTKLIFFPGKLPADYRFTMKEGMEELFIKTSDGEVINGLFYKGTRSELIIYFHGNAGDLSSWQQIADDFTSFGFNLLLIDYRGYGKSTGEISESGFYNDAEAALQFATSNLHFKPGDIIAYGRSIGSGVAVDLCSKHQLKGLMLEAPYASLRELIGEKVPFLLPNLWLSYVFDSKAKLKSVTCPMMIVHGKYDEVIPFHHSQILFETYHGKKHLVLIEGGPHNNLNVFPEYFQCITTAASGFFD